MLIDGKQAQPYRTRRKYTHMLSADATVWDAFIRLQPDRFENVWYDVHVGTPVPTAGGPNTMLSRIAAGITRKRIDAVAYNNNTYYVLEIKPYANAESLGQAIIYRRLLMAEHPKITLCEAAVICWRQEADVAIDYEDHGIQIWEIEELTGPLRT